ncbi:MAG: hypothetical protein NUV32_09065 [Exilispira sp.]|jgi:hypothetical protein|nr:hypothetical protein [Exilispira sp.]
MARLQVLEMLSYLSEPDSNLIINAFEPIKFHREFGKSLCYFGRSKRFWKLKYPYVWYNALYLADILTRFKILKNELLVKELIEWIKSSQNDN